LNSSSQRSDAPFSRGPVTWRRVEYGLFQAVIDELSLDIRRWELIGEQEFHRLETVLRRRAEPVEESVFVVHHGQVGSEARHGRVLVAKTRFNSMIFPEHVVTSDR
jgi:hypothetical protein